MPSIWDAYVASSNLSRTLDTPYFKGTGKCWGQTIQVSSGARALDSWIIWLQGYQTFYIGDAPFGTFAVSFGYPLNPDATNRKVFNIWANGRLIWSNATGAVNSADGDEIAWRFFPGSETQLQADLMAADPAESRDTTPAYRGQMIMVFSNFPLTDFENALPSITAEIIDSASQSTRERMVDELALFTNFTGSLDATEFLSFDPPLLEDTADGVILSANWALVDVFSDYGQFYGFDFCESGGQIKFFRPVNAGNYVLTGAITETDIYDDGGNSSQGAVLTTRADAGAIPTILTLTYIDRSQQYQTSIQRARRPQFPQRSVLSESSATLEVPLIITASEALTGAVRALYRYAHQQLTHQFSLPPQWLALEPGDVMSLAVGGKTYIVQIMYVEIQPDLSLKVTAKNVAYGADYAENGFAPSGTAGALRNFVADRHFNLNMLLGPGLS